MKLDKGRKNDEGKQPPVYFGKQKMIRPVVSVIIPVYNVAPYLREALDSVVNQTYKKLEIIVVDDGSTDGSGTICDEWAQRDKRIRVFHKSHEGVSEARNMGLLKCKGQLIGFADADDWLEPDMIELLAGKLNQADAVMCGFQTCGTGIPVIRGTEPLADGTFEEIVRSLIKENGYFTAIWNKMFHREVIFRNQGAILMDPALSFGEDEVWLYEVLQGCKCISTVPRALYHWRIRGNSLSNAKALSKNRMSIVEAKKKALELLPSSEAVQSFMKGKTYDDLHNMKIEAYNTKDWDNYHIITSFINPFRWAFLKTLEISLTRKIKVVLLDCCVFLRMPQAITESLSSIGRKRTKKLFHRLFSEEKRVEHLR